MEGEGTRGGGREGGREGWREGGRKEEEWKKERGRMKKKIEW